jgi:biopolymer transport protein ExbB
MEKSYGDKNPFRRLQKQYHGIQLQNVKCRLKSGIFLYPQIIIAKYKVPNRVIFIQNTTRMFQFFLLQADTATRLTVQSDGTQRGVSLIDLLTLGGWIMIPLAALFLITIFVFFERFLSIRKASNIDGNFMNIVRDHIINGNLTAARSFAKNTNNPVARIIDKGIQRIGKPIENIERSMENVGKLELYNMERNLSVLSLIAGIAPMFGFLGTIIGMFTLFFDLAATGEFTIQTMANGIYTKMITSATGLIIGLLAYIAHNFLSTQVDKTANRMESASSEFLDVLQEPTR